MTYLRLFPLVLLVACSFAPVVVSVPDFDIRAGSSGTVICYAHIKEAIGVQFGSVRYEGDALFTPGQSIGALTNVEMVIYGRATDPNPNSSQEVKCVEASAADTTLSDPITLEVNLQRRVSAGGRQLASLVTESSYWIGASIEDDSFFSLPGTIEFTDGVVKANF